MVLAAKLISRAATHIGQKVIDPEELTRVRNHFTYTGESRQPELLWQHQTILQLGREHVAIDILSGCISAEFIVRPINAIAIKRRLSSGKATKEIVGEDLIPSEARIFIEGEPVRLKGVLAAKVLGEEVGGELQLHSSGREKLVRSSVSDDPQPHGPQRSVEPNVRRNGRGFPAARPLSHNRISCPESAAGKDLPLDDSKEFGTKNLARLIER